jgi:hypothetical protein
MDTQTHDTNLKAGPFTNAVLDGKTADSIADPNDEIVGADERPIATEAVDLPNLATVDGNPATLAGTVDQLKRVVRAGSDTDAYDTPRVDRAKNAYGRLLHGDRRVQEAYDGLTTVLLTFRLRPVSDGETPSLLTLRDQLNQTWEIARRRLNDRLDAVPFNYCWVVSGTATDWATPHLHVAVYVDDPADMLEASDFDSVIQAHLDAHPNAHRGDHLRREDTGGVTIDYDPDPAEGVELPRAQRRFNDDGVDDPDPATSGDTYTPVTRLAYYLASQIPRVLILDPLQARDSAPEWAWKTAAWAYASDKDSMGTSDGWPA